MSGMGCYRCKDAPCTCTRADIIANLRSSCHYLKESRWQDLPVIKEMLSDLVDLLTLEQESKPGP